MKTFWIIALVIIVGSTAWATPLDDKLKSFAEALKKVDTSKSTNNPMAAAQLENMAAQIQSLALIPGGEANLEAQIRQMMTMNSSEDVQTTGKAVLDELATQRKARTDALNAQINDVLARVPDILIKAQKTQELDGILDDLQKIKSPQGGMYGYDQESQLAMNRVNSAYQFVAQWQDYLSAKNNGNIQEAQNSLRNLLNSRQPGDTSLVPRSEILARTTELAPVKPGSVGISPSGESAGTSVSAVLSGIKTLDDMAPALSSLRSNNTMNDFQRLSQLAGIYADAKNGLPVSIDNSPNQFGYNQVDPGFARLRAMLLLYLLPIYLGSDALAPNPNEAVNDYLQRSIDAAEAKQNWTLLPRIIGAKMKIAQVQGTPAGTRDFLAALNQDVTGQYDLAIASYQTALTEPDDFIPTKVIGDRLAAIKKDHPEDYDEGMKRFLNPPVRSYYPVGAFNPYVLRPGMPGYPGTGTTLMTNGIPSVPAAPAAPPATPAPATSTNAAPASPASPTK